MRLLTQALEIAPDMSEVQRSVAAVKRDALEDNSFARPN